MYSIRGEDGGVFQIGWFGLVHCVYFEVDEDDIYFIMKFMLIERLLLHMVYIEKYEDSMEGNIILLRWLKRWD
jgi:hypothetical protein